MGARLAKPDSQLKNEAIVKGLQSFNTDSAWFGASRWVADSFDPDPVEGDPDSGFVDLNLDGVTLIK